jgi:hypothetical protein
VEYLCYHIDKKSGHVNVFTQFSKIVAYLNNPYALIGLLLIVVLGLLQILLRKNFLPKLSQSQASPIIRLIVKSGFRLSVLIVVAAIGYAVFRVYEDNGHGQTSPTVQQKAGDCGANVNGSQNRTSVNCGNGGNAK